MRNSRSLFAIATSFILSLLTPTSALAHVKWFTRASLEQSPQSFSGLNHAAFWGLLALTCLTLAVFVYADMGLRTWSPYVRVNKWLESYSPQAVLILRIFTGAALLLSWQADAMIAPELKIPGAGAGWYQFFLALLLLGQVTTPLAGLGMIAFYCYAITLFGFFHMLDYLVYPAIGYFLLVSSFKEPKISATRVPALYVGLGFSLMWAALEKIFFPDWGLDVLTQQPALTMGLPHSFFLMACAFIELSLGYLLIIGLLQRPLALTITLTFFTTTVFFGKTEVVGHTILHGALLVFVVLGPGGYYRPPIDFHQKTGLRAAFAAINFVLLFALFALPYQWFSQRKFEARIQGEAVSEQPHDHADEHTHSH